MAMPASDDINLHDVEDYSSDVTHDQLPSVEEARSSMGITKHSSSSFSPSKRMAKIAGGCVVVVLLLITIISLSSNKKKSQQMMGSAQIPRNVEKAIDQIALNGKDDFDGEESYQSIAKRWLMEDELVENYTYDQLQQRYAMYCLYHATTPSAWVQAHGWKRKGIPECEWYGVSCHHDDATMVSRIELRNNSLKGTIPPEVSLIPQLMVFTVSSNDLAGAVPPHICRVQDERDLTVKVDCLEVTCECCSNCAAADEDTTGDVSD